MDIKKLRKQFNIPAKIMIDIQMGYKIIKEITDKKISIIDHETNEELDEDETYILLKNQLILLDGLIFLLHLYIIRSIENIEKFYR